MPRLAHTVSTSWGSFLDSLVLTFATPWPVPPQHTADVADEVPWSASNNRTPQPPSLPGKGERREKHSSSPPLCLEEGWYRTSGQNRTAVSPRLGEPRSSQPRRNALVPKSLGMLGLPATSGWLHYSPYASRCRMASLLMKWCQTTVRSKTRAEIHHR